LFRKGVVLMDFIKQEPTMGHFARVPFPTAFQRICDQPESTPRHFHRTLAVAPFLPLILALCGATVVSRLVQSSIRQAGEFTLQIGRVVPHFLGRCHRAAITMALSRKPS
jgi:hypothetical protein